MCLNQAGYCTTKLSECYRSQWVHSLGCVLSRCLVVLVRSSVHSLMRITDSIAMHCAALEEPQIHSIYLHYTALCFHIPSIGAGRGRSCHINTCCAPSQNWPAGLSHLHPHVGLKCRDKRRPARTWRGIALLRLPAAFAKYSSVLFLQLCLFWGFRPMKYLPPVCLALLLHMLFSKFLNVEHVVGSISFSGLGMFSAYTYITIYPFTLQLMRHWPFPSRPFLTSPLWIHTCMYLFQILLLILWGRYSKIK